MSEEALKKARQEAKTLRTRLMELRRDTPKREGAASSKRSGGLHDTPSSRVTSRSDQIQQSLRGKMEAAGTATATADVTASLPNRHKRPTPNAKAGAAAVRPAGSTKQTPAPRDCILDSKYRDAIYRS